MLLDYSRLDFRNPAFEPVTSGNTLWTSTVDYDFGDGKQSLGIRTDSSFVDTGLVDFGDRNYLCVRGEVLETNLLVDNGDLTVTDTGTNLMWQQHTVNESPSNTWSQALAPEARASRAVASTNPGQCVAYDGSSAVIGKY